MPELGNENLRAPVEKLKKRAYSIQSRMQELGQPMKLTHAYEALATASGYRNWPTMRAAASAHGNNFLVGHEAVFENDPGKPSFNRKIVGNLKSPVLLSGDEVRHHFEVVGTNDSERQATLLGMAENAIRRGSATVFFDIAGDPAGQQRLLRLARKHGREEDIVTIDLRKKGVSDVRLNPFKYGSAIDLAEILNTQDQSGKSFYPYDLDGLWLGRRMSYLHGLMSYLVWKRDNASFDLDLTSISASLGLAEHIGHLEEAQSLAPEELWKPLSSYLASIPGFDPALGKEQGEIPMDQHGFLQMILTKRISEILANYAHIFDRGDAPPTTLTDLIGARRIVHIRLPQPEHKEPPPVEETFRILYLDMIRSICSRNETNRQKEVFAIVDGAGDILPKGLGETLTRSTEAGCVIAFGLGKSLPIAEMKRATSIFMNQADPTRATVVTSSRSIEAVMSSVR